MQILPLFLQQYQCADVRVHDRECNCRIFILPCTSYRSCSTALCPDPAHIVNGTVTFSGNSVGDTATYTCIPGFELIGNASATCMQVDMNIAAFAPAAPVCRRKYV